MKLRTEINHENGLKCHKQTSNIYPPSYKLLSLIIIIQSMDGSYSWGSSGAAAAKDPCRLHRNPPLRQWTYRHQLSCKFRTIEAITAHQVPVKLSWLVASPMRHLWLSRFRFNTLTLSSSIFISHISYFNSKKRILYALRHSQSQLSSFITTSALTIDVMLYVYWAGNWPPQPTLP